ncbi:CBS domain-containing protein [Thermodesulforhabdus norvegica]|uniref:tRNA nucleotidyltransferase (CCA-adding enzyme) n=1 Tax=Thermodesulforhabdus norvegica TaxID=39841 RepID=A0A1I4UA94_9BACT|nr:CBS domain-containing protein [Thermodesulforhabdus norvegica]SFM85771.1 tRNA nucleotidyltransferase (CCA-adding enzyme) [Thermodesulforhabdus norvegica]
MDVITTHLNADFDALASMIAAKKLYPDADVVFAGAQEKLVREFLAGSFIKKIPVEFKRFRDLDLSRVKRLILVDTRQRSRIGRFEEVIGRSGLEIHIYDHHPDAEDDVSGAVSIIKPVGATTTILTQLIREQGIMLTPEEATVLALGIYEDTGSFTFSSTTPDDLKAAAYLLTCGADLNVVADIVTRDLTREQVSLLNELINAARIYTIHGIDICISSISVNKYVGDFALIVHKFRDMENLNVVFALARMEDRVYMVARSRIPEVNVGEIASYFGGGGHATAASATIRGKTLIEVENKLWEVLQSRIRPTPVARDLMSQPPICVNELMPLKSVEEVMIRFNINAVPVVRKDSSEPVGVLSRQTVEKALYHGFDDAPARDYMNRDFKVVGPDATILEIQEPLVEFQQRILPVVEDGRIIGVITRRDLLKYLVEERSTHPRELNGELLFQKKREKNIESLLREQLPEYVIDILKRMGRLGHRLGYGVYAVGGFVRDILLRRPNLDIDIVVEGDGIVFARAFAQEEGIRVRTHKKFNTAVLIFPDGMKIDVATARLEYYRYPAALPVVEFGSLKMDLYRRDFTINTLAVDLRPERFGRLIDFFGGQKDLKEKTIRVLHSLSFVEDPTRILRAIRFEQRFGFQIGRQTERLMQNAVKIGLIEKIGGHRLFHELQLILMENDPVPALRRMDEFQLLGVLDPLLKWTEKKEKLFRSLKDVLSWYELSFLDEPVEKWWIYFCALLDGLNASQLEGVCKKLDLPEGHKTRLFGALRNIYRAARELEAKESPPPSIAYRILNGLSTEELLLLMAKTEIPEVRKSVNFYLTRYRYVSPEIKGRDLKEAGVPPGPIYRKILDELLYAKLDGLVYTKQDEWEYLKRHYPEIFKDES